MVTMLAQLLMWWCYITPAYTMYLFPVVMFIICEADQDYHIAVLDIVNLWLYQWSWG